MPISLLPTRRQFLAAAAAGTALLARGLPGAEKKRVDESRFALLADTHIPASADFSARMVNMAENLRGVVKQLTAQETNPAAAFVIGDCAYLEGKPDDYKLLGELLAPLGEQGLPVHLCLGNHDDRRHCVDAFPASDAAAHTAVERRVCVLPGKHANWFLLDSLDIVNKAPGLLGENQLKWLVAALEKHADKPALIAVHHNPIGIGGHKTPGLVDAPALLDLAAGRKQVKAVFFGHSHVWQVSQQDGLHLVNLPPVAYVFGPGKPNGWVDCQLSERGATLKLLCHDTQHAEHGKTVELEWRA